MTVSSSVAFSGPFTGNGVTTAFPFTFKSMGAEEVVVLVSGSIVSSGSYSVTLNDNGGTVTFTTPPTGTVVIAPDPSFLQDVDFQNNGAFLPDTFDELHDRSATRDIYLKGRIEASVRAPLGEVLSQLPKASSRAGKLIGFDDDGDVALYNAASGGSPTFGAAGNYDSILNYREDSDTTDSAAFALLTAAVSESGAIGWLPAGGGLGADGEYIIGTAGQNTISTAGNLASNIRIVGDGAGKTVVRQDPDLQFAFFCNPIGNGASAAAVHVVEAGDGYNNIIIEDMTLKSDVETMGFNEFRCLIMMNAVKNVIIQRVEFVGWQGDALQFGAGDIGGGTQRRHNANILVRDCIFDGINKNNRQAISLLDYDKCIIEGSLFENCTKPGGVATYDPMDPNTGLSMPAAIDVEPNGFTSNVVCRGLIVRNNVFRNCGQAALAIYVLANGVNNFVTGVGSWGENQRDFLFTGNIVEDCGRDFSISGNVTQGGVVDGPIFFGTVPLNVRITGNTFRGNLTGMRMFSGDGIVIEGNRFEGHDGGGNLGWVGGSKIREFSINNNVFKLCGAEGTGAFQIYEAEDGIIADNLFEDCSGTGFMPVTGGLGVTKSLKIERNIFRATTGAAKTMTRSIIQVNQLTFASGGTTQVIEGMEIVGATSGARARVTFVSLTSGSWAAGTAAGTFALAEGILGTFENENIDIVGGATNVATVASLMATIEYHSIELKDNSGLVSEGFIASGAEVAGRPFSGDWRRGNFLTFRNKAAGEISRSVVVRSFVAADVGAGIPADIEAVWADEYIPGAPDDSAPTTALTPTLGAGMAHSAGRFTATDDGFVWAIGPVLTGDYTIRILAPRASDSGVHVGLTNDNTPASMTDLGITLWLEQGTIHTKNGNSPFGISLGTYEYLQEIVFDKVGSNYTISTTDPTTGVTEELTTDVFSMIGTTYLVVAFNDAPGATVFVDEAA